MVWCPRSRKLADFMQDGRVDGARGLWTCVNESFKNFKNLSLLFTESGPLSPPSATGGFSWRIAAPTLCFLQFQSVPLLEFQNRGVLQLRRLGSLSETKLKREKQRLCSLAVTGAVALPQGIVAVTRLRELTVRTDAGLRVHAPKQTVIARRDGMVVLGIDEKALPTKRRAQMRMAGIKP